MKELAVVPWKAVNANMTDEYREKVVEVALERLPKASKSLQRFAARALSTVSIPGFRSLSHAPERIAKRYIIKEMLTSNHITAAIICLWGDAKKNGPILDLSRTAGNYGWRIRADWTWEEARAGFYSPEDMDLVGILFKEIPEEYEDLEKDDLLLATLWLSRGFVQKTEESLVIEESTETTLPPKSLLSEKEEESEAEAPCLKLDTQDSEDVILDEVIGQTFEMLITDLHFSQSSLMETQQSVIAQARNIISNLESGALDEAQEQVEHIANGIKSWHSQRQKLQTKTAEAAFRVTQELDTRLDLDFDHELREQMHEISSSEELLPDNIKKVLRAAEQIFVYDEKKDKVLTELGHVQAKMFDSLSDLAVWVEDTTVYEGQLVESEVLDDITLKDAQDHLAGAKTYLQEMKKQLVQLTEASCNRIIAMAKSIQENSETQEDCELLPGFLLYEINIERIAGLKPERLLEIEHAFEDFINRRMMEETDNCHSPAIAAELLQHWESGLIEGLLQALAEESRDMETVILLLASVAAHPSTEKLALNDGVVDSFLRGLDLLSEEASPSKLFNLGVSTLLHGWKPQEAISKAKLCLHLIAAKYAGEYQLSSNFFWEVATEWPFSHMPSWAKLWEQALSEGECPVIVDERQDPARSALDQARQQCEQMFVREGGVFVRLHGIQSRRHQAMLCDSFLPDFGELWQSFQDIESELDHASEVYEIARWVAQLETLIRERMGDNLGDNALIELYDHAVYKAKIQEHKPFHRRTTLRVLREYVQSLDEYSQALLQYWKPRTQQETVLSRKVLLEELSSQPALVPIAQFVIAEISRCDEGDKPEWVGVQAEQKLHGCFLSALLGRAAYARRLPHTVGYLVANQIVWADLFFALLKDLAQPIEVDASVRMLLEQRAPNQALLLAQQVPLELQKQIQNQRVKEEKRIAVLQEELLKIGGDAEDLTESRRLGRWPLLTGIMENRLNLRRAETEKKTLQLQQQARELLSAVHKLELEIFEFQSLLPVEVYDLVEQGLNLSRSIVRQSESFQEVRDYLSEVRYRLDHESWSSADLKQMVEDLREVQSGATTQLVERNAKAVLDLLQQGDLRALGLSPTDIAPSEVNTRVDLLQSWLGVQGLSSFLSDSLMRMQRDKIHKLFSAFAQMAAMSRRRTHTGNPLMFEDPTVYEYWELKYPMVSMLERDCVFVVMPGAPPSPQYLKAFDNVIRDREWLTYSFVFLFAPGLTEPQRKRLNDSYKNEGLVIINEQMMLEMVLAESRTRKPLGCLRAMMLNAYGAQSVDVFKVNQAVDRRIGIFVGRDYLVRKISGSGDNYALYGGRRIGKSSVLKVVERLLRNRDWMVVSESLEGRRDYSDDAIARTLATKLPLDVEVQTIEDFRTALQQYLDNHLEAHIVLLLDEIDPYIRANPERHVFIETMRALAEQYGNRFRVIVAGFMYLYDCLQGNNPYSPSSDPWRRMFNATRLDNLSAISAERIAKDGFWEVLGWDFENRAVARSIVERTSGHPAFVQYYCMKLKDRVAQRGDRCVRMQDVFDVFADESPEDSFISHVRSTLAMNLDSIGRYVILWLATESKEMHGFTFAQAQEIASLSGVEIPEDDLKRALKRLEVTSVVVERSPGVFDFSVPDYPFILNRLGDTAHLDVLESELKEHSGGVL